MRTQLAGSDSQSPALARMSPMRVSWPTASPAESSDSGGGWPVSHSHTDGGGSAPSSGQTSNASFQALKGSQSACVTVTALDMNSLYAPEVYVDHAFSPWPSWTIFAARALTNGLYRSLFLLMPNCLRRAGPMSPSMLICH